jgi:hypothetical protein
MRAASVENDDAVVRRSGCILYREQSVQLIVGVDSFFCFIIHCWKNFAMILPM